jgi:small subunit ribosomal protein S17
MRKQRIGFVISNKAQKTIIVAVENRFAHPKYRKIVTKTKKYMAHDEENICNLGDIVLLEETRPLSKNKKWTLKQILRSNTTQK